MCRVETLLRENKLMYFFKWVYFFTTFTTFYRFYCCHYWFFGFVFLLDTWLFYLTPIFVPKTTDNIWALEIYINSSNIEINRNPNFDMLLWYNYSSQYTSFFVNSLTHLLRCLYGGASSVNMYFLACLVLCGPGRRQSHCRDIAN